MRGLLASLVCVVSALGQGTTPKQAAKDYAFQEQLPDGELGVDYLVNSAGSGREGIVTGDYLVLEIAVYPQNGRVVKVSSGKFRLRLNGKKDALFSQAPGAVLASVKYPDWRQRPRAVMGASAGQGSVVLGNPAPVERFPGDPTVGGRLPRRPVEAPVAAELDKPAVDVSAVIEGSALPSVRRSIR